MISVKIIILGMFLLLCMKVFLTMRKAKKLTLCMPSILFLQVLLEIMFIHFVMQQKVKTLEQKMQPSLTYGFLIMLR